jgi:hypothetical protein
MSTTHLYLEYLSYAACTTSGEVISRISLCPGIFSVDLISVSMSLTSLTLQILHSEQSSVLVGEVSPFDAIPKRGIKRIRQGSSHQLVVLTKNDLIQTILMNLAHISGYIRSQSSLSNKPPASYLFLYIEGGGNLAFSSAGTVRVPTLAH